LSQGSREISIAVGPEVAWAALVGEGRRTWYYLLTPDGGFTAGSHIRWLSDSGTVAEESDVVEILPPERLKLRTRFVFAPGFAAADPHEVVWEMREENGGCRVRVAWDAEGPVERLMESEAEAQLQGLRLEVDPAAHTELARLPSIGDVTIRDVTVETIGDYLDFFDHHAFRDYPVWQSCYCMETHRTGSDDEWAERTAADNREDMTSMIKQGRVTGLLAYADGQPVGWCNFGESTRLGGLVHRFGFEAADHEGVGSVACFVIASQYRGHGVASKLLDAAVDRLRLRGVRAVEAYPARAEDSPQSNYRGPLSMYVSAGFEPYRETERHLIMRKSLA
jgi:ribosomal protein S18 acetylase RimI-like enzyme